MRHIQQAVGYREGYFRSARNIRFYILLILTHSDTKDCHNNQRNIYIVISIFINWCLILNTFGHNYKSFFIFFLSEVPFRQLVQPLDFSPVSIINSKEAQSVCLRDLQPVIKVGNIFTADTIFRVILPNAELMFIVLLYLGHKMLFKISLGLFLFIIEMFPY